MHEYRLQVTQHRHSSREYSLAISLDAEEAPAVARTFAQTMQRAMVGKRQADVARLLGLTQAQVSRWVRGEGLPKDQFIPVIAKGLGLDEDALRRTVERERRSFVKPKRPVDRFVGIEERLDRLAGIDERLDRIDATLDELIARLRSQGAQNDGDLAVKG